MKNYIKLKQLSLFYNHFCYVDTDKYLADKLFINNKVKVHFNHEFKRGSNKYVLIFCKVNKKDTDRFLKSLEELPNKMLLMGNTDYEEFCNTYLPKD